MHVYDPSYKKYVGLKYTITQPTINNYINYYDFLINDIRTRYTKINFYYYLYYL